MAVIPPEQVLVGGHKLTLRSLAKEDLSSFHKLIHSVDFNRTQTDLRHYFEDKGNLMLGVFNEREQLLSTCMGTLLSETDAYISLWITRKDFQGQGIGKLIRERTFKFLGNRNLILDSGPNTLSTYAKCGFKTVERYNLYLGRLKPSAAAKVKVPSVHPLTIEECGALSLYEQDITNLNRQVMFSKLTESGTASCFVSKSNTGFVNGYGIVTQNGSLSALCADDLETARTLFDVCVKELQSKYKVSNLRFLSYENKSVIISKLLEGYIEEEFKHGILRTLSRMVTEKCPPVQLDKVYALGLHAWSVSC